MNKEELIQFLKDNLNISIITEEGQWVGIQVRIGEDLIIDNGDYIKR